MTTNLSSESNLLTDTIVSGQLNFNLGGIVTLDGSFISANDRRRLEAFIPTGNASDRYILTSLISSRVPDVIEGRPDSPDPSIIPISIYCRPGRQDGNPGLAVYVIFGENIPRNDPNPNQIKDVICTFSVYQNGASTYGNAVKLMGFVTE